MANDNLKLTDRKVLEYARTSLQEHLPLQAEGYKCSTEDLLNVLLGASVNSDTIESVCADLVEMPAAETLRQYLNEQLIVKELSELEKRLNAALAAEIPPCVWRQACDVAIDFHDRPYYGKTSQEEGLWVRGYGICDIEGSAVHFGDPLFPARRRYRDCVGSLAVSCKGVGNQGALLVLG